LVDLWLISGSHNRLGFDLNLSIVLDLGPFSYSRVF